MISIHVDPAVRGRLTRAEHRRLRTRLRRMTEAAAATDGFTDGAYELTLRLVDDAAIRELNRDYRGKDRPTDVLAFAQREGPAGKLHPELLGDLVISLETARRQAKAGLFEEVVFLATHGLCHLLGYDHQTDGEEAEMNARMARLLEEGGKKGPVRAA